jgi:DNA helicase-2/ATP-dependent DNA helicase PcrA
MNNILDNLNPQQKKAVTADLGQVLVLAGPGSGKTRVLTLRVAYLILTLGVRPANILAVTFTNKAAREMENRLSTLLGEKIQGIWLGTFHATCARLLPRIRSAAVYCQLCHLRLGRPGKPGQAGAERP